MLLRTLAYAGIDKGLSRTEAKTCVLKNKINIIVLATSAVIILQAVILETRGLYTSPVVYLGNGSALAFYCVSIILSFYRRHALSKVLTMMTINAQILWASVFFGRYTGFDLYFFGAGIGPFLIFIKEKKTRYAFSALSFLLLLGIELHYSLYDVKPVLPALNLTIGYLTSLALISVLLFTIINDLQTTNLRFENYLKIEREKSDGLLLNILPHRTVDVLKGGAQTIADDIADASVLFADIVGFTNSTKNTSAKEIVSSLNVIYRSIDGLIEECGLEKIKTIGDAYMVASGVPEERGDHAERLIDFALILREKACELDFLGRKCVLRIGISSGPLVAGVIGTHRYIYDLWGETVNLASRMESLGVPGKIQIPESLYRQVKDSYLCEKRGLIDIKGMGQIETYFILDKSGGPSEAS